MNKRTYILVFLLLLAGFTSELSAQKKPKKAKQEISVVSGQVVDSSGIPVAGALVTAMEGAYFARTDADGAFSVKSGAADYILIEAEGYEPKEVYLPDLAAGQAIALEASPYRSGSADRVELPFGTLTDRRVVGAVIWTAIRINSAITVWTASCRPKDSACSARRTSAAWVTPF